MSDISIAVRRMTEITGEIANASPRSGKWNRAGQCCVSQMDELAQHNAELAEETSATARAISEQVTQLSELVERFGVGEAGPTPVGDNSVNTQMAA